MPWFEWVALVAADLGLGLALGWFVRSQLGRARLRAVEQRAETLLSDAQRDADALKRDAVLAGREEALGMKQALEREMLQVRNAQLEAERAFQQKEAAFNRRVELIDKKERELKAQESDVTQREAGLAGRQRELEALADQQTAKLARIAGLSAEQAREQLIASIEAEARSEAARRTVEVRETAQRNAEREARKIITLAVQRYAGDHASESSVSVVQLPSDDMKGRIIGREGRNIRSFEVITGVDVIIDDTPEAVILSAFDPVRREVARISLERLVADGRIHPARIEEVVGKVREEVDRRIAEMGRPRASRSAPTACTPSSSASWADCTTARATARTSCATRSRSPTCAACSPRNWASIRRSPSAAACSMTSARPSITSTRAPTRRSVWRSPPAMGSRRPSSTPSAIITTTTRAAVCGPSW
jgi:ribonuclease Y